MIEADDVSTLLDKLDIEHDKTSHQSNRIELRKVPVPKLKELLERKGESVRGKKEDLQKKLFKALLGRNPRLQGDQPARASTHCCNLQSAQEGCGTTEESMNTNDEVGGRSSPGIDDDDEVQEVPGLQQAANPKTAAQAKSDSSEGWVWDKGAFLSFLANIDYQIEFLAVLREIW